jgi:hypothetical protein
MQLITYISQGGLQELVAMVSILEFRYVTILSLILVFLLAAASFQTIFAKDDAEEPKAFSSDPLWSSPFQIDPRCQLDIRGDSPIMYAGNYTHLYVQVNGTAPKQYAWSVEPDIVKDYDDKFYDQGQVPVSSVEAPTPMEGKDFKKNNISFYWKPEEDTNRTVAVRALTDNGICEDIENYVVVKGNTSTTQPEDLFVTTIAPDHQATNALTDVLQQHEWWHSDHASGDETYEHMGHEFFTFHKILLAHFDAFRTLFGYPPIEAWNSSSSIPNGSNVDYIPRGNNYVALDLQPWFKPHANGTGQQARDDKALPCEKADPPSTSWPYKNQDALSDFEPNMMLLGCAITIDYHDRVHSKVGGDMAEAWDAPRDPLFWRFHKFIDDIYETRKAMDNPSPITSVAMGKFAGLTDIDNSPPQIEIRNPQEIFPFATEMPKLSSDDARSAGLEHISDQPAISIIFNEPVTGVLAKDLSINESPATNVVGEGPGAYLFTGFDQPPTGPVNITLSPGNIKDLSENLFEGDFWNITLLEPTNDTDNDGVSDGLEINEFLTDPISPDTDEDTMPDRFEIDSSCLRPLVDDRQVKDFSGNVINSTGFDSDNDGVTNVEEFRQNTSPCSS